MDDLLRCCCRYEPLSKKNGFGCETIIDRSDDYFLRFGSKESNAPFISFVREIKTKLPKKNSVANVNANAVTLSRDKL